MIPRSNIRSALRKLWLYSPARRDAKKRAKWNGTKLYRCQECHLPTPKPEVDHVVPLGATPGSKLDDGSASWDLLIARLFCSAEGLRVLCKACHLNKRQFIKEVS